VLEHGKEQVFRGWVALLPEDVVGRGQFLVAVAVCAEGSLAGTCEETLIGFTVLISVDRMGQYLKCRGYRGF
jgi:hypothetical protein